MEVLTKEQIKFSEEDAVQSGAFSFLELMKKAGDAATQIIYQKSLINNKKIAILCGNGNNGGDGFVIAQNLSNSGADVTVITPLGEPLTDSAKYYYSQLANIKKTDIFNDEYDIIIDALFGIGLNREISESIKTLFDKINKSNAYKIAVDIPSGIECDTGKILLSCIKVDLTITFIALKPCFMLPPASDYVGEVVVADIGVAPKVFKYTTIEPPVFKQRSKNSHKGTYGTAVTFCGSYGMAGAAILSARACIRSGVGILKCVLPKSIYPILTCAVPEAVCIPQSQTKSGTLKGNINFKNLLDKSTAILIGCGMGNNKQTAKLLKRLLLTATQPIVVDADGINALCSNINILKKTKAPIILTPHPGEMARLIGLTVKQVEENRIKVALDFAAKYNCIIALKGANTLIATPDQKIFFNICGNSGMATGGSGDVLAGITVSYLAQGMDCITAIKSAVYVHSNTADKVAKIKGERSLIPSDIIEAL